MKKILISDYDKTLYIDNDSMLFNIAAINKFRNRGNLFVIATARSFESLKNQIEKFSIPFDYLIVGHGSVVLDKNMKLVKECSLDNELSNSILMELDSFKERITQIRLYGVFSEDVSSDSEQITKLRVLTNRLEDAKDISKQMMDKYSKYIKAYVIDAEKYIFVEIISIKTDKGQAIEEVLNIEQIDIENVYTIGDSSNDIEMIKKYNGYGMTNSEQCILDITNKLCNNVYDLIEDII